jgi:hypothetical protein
MKKSYQARINANTKKMIVNIANYGLKKGQCAIIERSGEYHHFCIRALKDIKPLFVDYRVNKAIKFIKEGDIQKAIAVLFLQEECIKYGVGIIYNILEYYLVINEMEIIHEITNNKLDIELDHEIIDRLKTIRSDYIKYPIEIVNIGCNTSGSVVPESWIGRCFDNADILHKEIDKLDWRQNKPPVTYCVTYSMMIVKEDKWTKIIDNKKYEFILKINDNFSTEIILDHYDLEGYDVLYINNFVIACNLKKIIIQDNYVKTDVSVGVLVSRLQKSIRRGRTCSKVLYDSMKKLSRSKPYNLPELNYIKCSASKQLFWRLLITVLEDSSPYLDSLDNRYFSMQDLLIYSMIAHYNPDFLFNEQIINKIIYTGLLIIYQDKNIWNWRSGKINNKLKLNNNHDYLKIALLNLPMMSGDKILLDKSIDLLSTGYKLNKLKELDVMKILSYNNLQDNIWCINASNDHHCYPGIILQMQAALDFLPYDLDKHSTKAISKFIWTYSSSWNIRSYESTVLDEEKSSMLETLNKIHDNKKIIVDKKLYTRKYNQKIREEQELTDYQSRLGFILLFGRTNKYNTSVSGDINMPFRVKYKNEYITNKNKIYYTHIDNYINFIKNQSGGVFDIRNINPPEGCYWNFSSDQVVLYINKLDQDNYEFFVNNNKIKLFDSSSFLKRYPILIDINLPKNLEKLVKYALYLENKSEYNLDMLLQVSKIRSDNHDYQTYRWHLLLQDKDYTRLFKNVLTKLYNNYNDIVIIGPVDRLGKKLDQSINYLYEGTFIRIFNMLSMLYPRVVKNVNLFKYNINKNNPEYMNMIDIIRKLAHINNKQENDNDVISYPMIKTTLWNHQQKSANFILNGFIKHHKRGFGDASNVGSGKTLTALYIACALINKCDDNYNGILVLLPTVNLYNTWIDEIQKHTMNLDIILQDQSGKLSGIIKKNSIIITSLGRMRDHPVYNSWILCIIDECLSVQNKDALQTEEAWKQVLCSKYGVIMMSATFFRSRFDKLYYMLKILNSNIPETREYLDLILSENIVCNIRCDSKKWNTKIYRYDLDPELRKEYDQIYRSNLDIEKIYIKLQKLLHDKFNYIYCFLDIINELDKDQKALIYTKSKSEADILVLEGHNISRYPDKSKKHVVVSYAEGTFGLNDLIKYNTIITRPPEGDKLPQMKGRLDRPGNNHKQFYIIYLIADKTIDEAHLISLDMCDNFYKNYIMPIADLYKIIKQIHDK